MTQPLLPLSDKDAGYLSSASVGAALAEVSIKTLNSRCFCISLD